MLLQEGEGHSGHQADAHARQRDQAALQNEDLPDRALRGAQAEEGADIGLLLDDEHGERTEHVEGDDDDHEDEDQVDGQFLVAHHLVHRFVLVIAVQDPELRPQQRFQLFLESGPGMGRKVL